MCLMRLVRGTGLSESMANAGDNIVCQQYTTQSFSNDPWYADVVYLMLNNRCPEGMNSTQRRSLRLRSSHYMFKGGLLYRNNFKGVYLRCLDEQDAKQVISKFHGKHRTGHGSTDSLAHQILRSGYYWPCVFKDAHQHVRTCHVYQIFAPREGHAAMPL